MAFSYKTSISFGLVYIPIQLVATVINNRITFNQLDKKTGSRIRYKKTCDECDGKEVPPEDIVKAYEYEKHRYVIFDDEDLEKIKSDKDKSIVIEQFVNYDEIPSVYYNKPYYVLPSGADKAFLLLIKAMEEQNKVGIAKTVMGSKETLVAIIAKDGELTLNTMYFYDEIKERPKKEIDASVSSQELELANAIIKSMSSPFDPTKYKDEYTAKVLAAIEQKVAGKEITAPKESVGKIIDLMEALKLSLKPENLNKKETSAAKATSKSSTSPATKKSSSSSKTKKTAAKTPSKTTKKPAAVAKSK